MANVKPYMTTNDLIEFIKLSMAFPIDQSTFTYNNIVTLMNQELQNSAVPSMMETHEEYFVYKVTVPLVTNISVYAIPNRALGMVLRDVKYSDDRGNFFDMSRIAPEDKAFFQNNTGVNQVLTHYYLEGNNIILTPETMTAPTGNLNFFFLLRPNFLVRNDRACTIENFVKTITITDYAQIQVGDTITIVTGVQTPSPNVYTFTAVTGSPVNPGDFLIGADNSITATNLNNAMLSLGLDVSVATNVITMSYDQISTTFQTAAVTTNNVLTGIIDIDVDNIYIAFDQLPSSYVDPETQEVSELYSDGCLVDFLQTLPGHRTYTYDVTLTSILANNVGKFPALSFQTYQNNSSGGILTYYPVIPGDYMALQNECIIPGIPPELHSALAERTCSRILMAIGDREGYAVSQQKLAQMDKNQTTMIGSRVEGSVPKVFNRNNLLRMGKMSVRRRFL